MNPIIDNALYEIEKRLIAETPMFLKSGQSSHQYLLTGLRKEISRRTDEIAVDVLNEKNINMSEVDDSSRSYFYLCLDQYPIGATKIIIKRILGDPELN